MIYFSQYIANKYITVSDERKTYNKILDIFFRDNDAVVYFDDLRPVVPSIFNELEKAGFKNDVHSKMKYSFFANPKRFFYIKATDGKRKIEFRSFQNYTNKSIYDIMRSFDYTGDVITFMKKLYEECFSDFNRLTISSQSLKWFKQSITEKTFDRYFPQLTPMVNDYCQKAVNGGITYIKSCEHIEDIIYTYDKNSMYPTIASSDCLIPYGEPKVNVGAPQSTQEYPLFISHVRVWLSLKDDGIPCLFDSRIISLCDGLPKLIRETEGMIDLYLTSQDFINMMKNYHIFSIEFINSLTFKAVRAKDIFGKFINDHYNKKKNAPNKFVRFKEKMILNSLIGNFAKKSNNDILILKDDDFTKINSDVKTVYSPVSAFITAYARTNLIESANLIDRDNLLYMDTDSIHTTQKMDGLLSIGNELGQWKLESTATEAYYLKPKKYAEKINGAWDIKCSGLSNPTLDELLGNKVAKQRVLKITPTSKKYTYKKIKIEKARP